MIQNITKGRGVRGLFDYLLGDRDNSGKRRELVRIVGGTTTGDTPRELAHEHAALRSLRPDIAVAIAHISLSPDPASDRSLSDAEMAAIASEYAKRMGIETYTVVRHDSHFHIAASRIRSDGATVDDSNDYRRGERVVRQLEEQFGLRTLEPSHLLEPERASTHRRAPTQRQIAVAEKHGRAPPSQLVAELIDRRLAAGSCTVVDLAVYLEKHGIAVQPNSSPTTGRLAGLAYEIDGRTVTAKAMGRGYTWANLTKRGVTYDADRDGEALAERRDRAAREVLGAGEEMAGGTIGAGRPDPKRRYKAQLWASLYDGQALSPDLVEALAYIDTANRTVRLIDGAVVRDTGNEITASRGSKAAIQLMITEAQAKGWKSIRITGGAEFVRLSVAEAARVGLIVEEAVVDDAHRRSSNHRGGRDRKAGDGNPDAQRDGEPGRRAESAPAAPHGPARGDEGHERPVPGRDQPLPAVGAAGDPGNHDSPERDPAAQGTKASAPERSGDRSDGGRADDKRAPNSRGGVDRTLTAVEQTLGALPCDHYEVGVRDPRTKRMLKRRFTPDQLRAAVPWMRGMNAQGNDIYVRPDNTKYVLIDDLSAEQAAALPGKGLAPALITETSRGNFQAWLRLPEAPPAEVRTEIGRRLARELGADGASVDWRHLGRLPGFTNRKPERAVGGRSPYVLVRDSRGGVCPRGSELIRQAAAGGDERSKARSSLPFVAQKSHSDAARAEIAGHYRARAGDVQRALGSEPLDLSRLDFQVAMLMLLDGREPADVAAAIVAGSPNIAERKRDPQAYAERTVAAAMRDERMGDALRRRAMAEPVVAQSPGPRAPQPTSPEPESVPRPGV